VKGKGLISVLVFIISILLFELLSNRISTYILHLKEGMSPYRATLIGMGVIVFILFPAYKWLDGIVKRISQKLLSAGKNIGGRITGISLIFFTSLFALYLIYLNVWYNIALSDAIKHITVFVLNLVS